MSDPRIHDAMAVIGIRRTMQELVDGTLRVKIDIDPQYRAAFLQNFGDIDIPVGLVRLNMQPVEKVSAHKPDSVAHGVEKPYGKQASALYANGFFLVPKVLERIGTDKEFREWLETWPCAVNDSAYGPHEGDVVAAHVRRIANGAGGALKPDYSAIPLCNRHHQMQHQHGESKVGGKEWFDKQRAKYLQKWASHTLAKVFGQQSMGYVDPKDLRMWAMERKIDAWLPVEYKA